MANRLSALDASFLYLEDRSAPLHVGSVAVFHRPRTGFDYSQLVALVAWWRRWSKSRSMNC